GSARAYWERPARVAIARRRAVLMMRQAISPRLAIRIRLNMPRLGPRESGALGFAAQQAKCQQAVHGARTAKVNLVAAPPMARQPDARTARSAANQPRPMPAPMAILLTVSLATAARMASTACVRLRVSGVRRSIETVT